MTAAIPAGGGGRADGGAGSDSAETVRWEWRAAGHRWSLRFDDPDDAALHVHEYGDPDGRVQRRKVTYGPWEDVD